MFTRCGIPTHPSDLDLRMDAMVTAVLEAPGMRPNRYTVLNEMNLTPETVAALDRAVGA